MYGRSSKRSAQNTESWQKAERKKKARQKGVGDAGENIPQESRLQNAILVT